METSPDTERQRFDQLLADSLQNGRWLRLILAKPQGAEPDLQRVAVRPVVLKAANQLCFVYSYATRDITKNLAPAEGLKLINSLLGQGFRNAHLFTPGTETQLLLSKKGKAHVTVRSTSDKEASNGAEAAPLTPAPHDHAKQRWLDIKRPFLVALGVTTPQHQLVPAMARKWKQINKFVEIFAHALDRSALAKTDTLRVVDFGAGKAYLSFALHDWLQHSRGVKAEVVGVELREDLVLQGQQVIEKLGLQGMRMQQGDVREWQSGSPEARSMDVMIALHACDTATDHAIHLGIQAGAQLILCSPCCHKQLRPQLLSPHPLRSVFQHGIHAEQQAEMLTDSLRALLLESRGYDAQVFEFVALEHTRKNKMILAVKRPHSPRADAALAQVDELKRFFGVREHCLESLLSPSQA